MNDNRIVYIDYASCKSVADYGPTGYKGYAPTGPHDDLRTDRCRFSHHFEMQGLEPVGDYHGLGLKVREGAVPGSIEGSDMHCGERCNVDLHGRSLSQCTDSSLAYEMGLDAQGVGMQTSGSSSGRKKSIVYAPSGEGEAILDF